MWFTVLTLARMYLSVVYCSNIGQDVSKSVVYCSTIGQDVSKSVVYCSTIGQAISKYSMMF